VIVDTTLKTMQVYKGMQQQAIPEAVESRLWKAIEKKMAEKPST
jgi:hypothetical protein